MVKALVVGAIAWPMLLSGALAARVQHGAAPAFSAVVYLAASRVCHQRPERSFHWHGVKWPVCGRCSGLYLGGALGAIAIVAAGRRPRPAPRLLVSLAVAAVPTALTVLAEWSGLVPVGTPARFLAAVPLGVLVAVVIIRTAAGPSRAIE